VDTGATGIGSMEFEMAAVIAEAEAFDYVMLEKEKDGLAEVGFGN
jgi:hypothetical protein